MASSQPHRTVSSSVSLSRSSSAPTYQWCVVGAGPAGIAAVGLLLDSSVPPSSVLWIDPSFSVGDFGTKWRRVSSNTTVDLFTRFYRHCKAFGYDDKAAGSPPYAIQAMMDNETCLLDVAAAPLRDITTRLRSRLHSVTGTVQHITQRDGRWECSISPCPSSPSTSSPSSVLAANVVLALGAEPKVMSFHQSYPRLQVIPVTVALDPEQLLPLITPQSVVCVVGSSHTAIILIRTLLEQSGCRSVVNLYREPLRYALYMDDWILFDDTGLKGDTARWARTHLHTALPPRLTRHYSDDTAIQSVLPRCTHIIYATGFNPRRISGGIEGIPPTVPYNAHCGIIAPGLFGCGIAFPEERMDRYGNVELRVGLWKFMQYLEQIVPLWRQYSVAEGIGQPKGAPGTPGTDSAQITARL